MLSIVAPLKHLTLTDLKFVEIRFSLIPLIIESHAIKIVLLDQGFAFENLENLLHLSYLVRLYFAPKWFQMMSVYVKLASCIIIGFTRLVYVRCSIVERPWPSSIFREN